MNADAIKNNRSSQAIEPEKFTRKFYKNNSCDHLGAGAYIKKKIGGGAKFCFFWPGYPVICDHLNKYLYCFESQRLPGLCKYNIIVFLRFTIVVTISLLRLSLKWGISYT